jgi:hypothetical protein
MLNNIHGLVLTSFYQLSSIQKEYPPSWVIYYRFLKFLPHDIVGKVPNFEKVSNRYDFLSTR